jgi:excisionase family DNA binding protein
MGKLYTVAEVAAILQVSVVTVRRLIHRGELNGYWIGRQYRISEQQLREYLERAKEQA